MNRIGSLRRRFPPVIALVAGLLIFSSTPSVYADSLRGTLVHDGLERSYQLYVPDSVAESSDLVPLVVALHPFASSGRAMELLTGLDAAANERGFIIVYPDADYLYWDSGVVAAGWPSWAEPVDDVGYINALIDHLVAEYPVDMAQIHLVGQANGGVMAYRAACETPERFASVVVVGALMREFQRPICDKTSGGVKLFIILGLLNPDYPVGGSELGDAALRSWGLNDTVAFWLERNGCEGVYEIVHYTVIDGCGPNTALHIFAIEGAGKGWFRVGEDYALNQYGIDLTDVVTAFMMDEDWIELAQQLTSRYEVYGQITRSYNVYVPPDYDPETPAPVVIALHGRPDDGDGFAFISDMNRVAKQAGFIVVYPDGLNQEWNYVQGWPGYTQSPQNDEEFLALMMDDLGVDLHIDRSRVYVMGFSNGGFMTQRLACEAPNRYAAFAIIGATQTPDLAALCNGTSPVPILFIHGTKDPSIPWGGRIGIAGQPLLYSVQQTLIYWLAHNGCSTEEPEWTTIPATTIDAVTEVRWARFDSCPDGADIVFYGIINGGHNLPGVTGRLSARIAGNINMDIHAGEVIWEFFKEHTLAERSNEP